MPDYRDLLDGRPDTLTPDEVSSLLNVSIKSLRRGYWEQVLKPFRTVGGIRRYPKEHVAAFLNQPDTSAAP